MAGNVLIGKDRYFIFWVSHFYLDTWMEGGIIIINTKKKRGREMAQGEMGEA